MWQPSLCISNAWVTTLGEEEASKECGTVVLWSISQRSVIGLLESTPQAMWHCPRFSSRGWTRSKLFSLTFKGWTIGNEETSREPVSWVQIRGDKVPYKETKQSDWRGRKQRRQLWKDNLYGLADQSHHRSMELAYPLDQIDLTSLILTSNMYQLDDFGQVT